MYKVSGQISALVALLSLLVISLSCGSLPDPGGGVIPEPLRYPELKVYRPPETLLQPGSTWDTVEYVPYVEDVVLPEEIYENEPFEIILRVSADFRPSVLKGYPFWHKKGVFTRYPAQNEFSIVEISAPEESSSFYVLKVSVILVNPPGTGLPINRFVFDVPPLPAGQHILTFQTVTDRSFGGVGSIRDRFGNYYAGDKEFFTEVRKMGIALTVLPSGSSVLGN